jgi:hypothetical protein
MAILFSGPDLYQGSFVSDGKSKFIPLIIGCDSMEVRNETTLYAAGANTGVQYYWQKGMANGLGDIYKKTIATGALVPDQIAAGAGFYLVDTSDQTPGALQILTTIDNSTPPIVTAGAPVVASLRAGDVIRIINTTGALQFGGIEFTVGLILSPTTFQLAYGPTIVTTGAITGYLRKIPFNPIFYPRRRTISAIISVGITTVVQMTVTHDMLIGQKVNFVIPTVTSLAFGMAALNGVTATITDIDTTTNTITVDVDSSAMGTFRWPLTTDPSFTPPQVIPVGENTAIALTAGVNEFNDARFNQASYGMILMPGTLSPAGVQGDSIFWRAWKSGNL